MPIEVHPLMEDADDHDAGCRKNKSSAPTAVSQFEFPFWAESGRFTQRRHRVGLA